MGCGAHLFPQRPKLIVLLIVVPRGHRGSAWFLLAVLLMIFLPIKEQRRGAVMRFEFATASRVLFGAGVAREVAAAAKEMGTRALVVTRRSGEAAAWLVRQLSTAGVSSSPFAVAGEPTVDVVRSGLLQAQQESCDLVIASGGGSAIDAAKAIAALLTNPGEVLETHPESPPQLRAPVSAGQLRN
jgi:Iron-containing alcohol dehydrogenase